MKRYCYSIVFQIVVLIFCLINFCACTKTTSYTFSEDNSQSTSTLVYENLESVLSQITYVKGGREEDTIALKSYLNKVRVSNGQEMIKKYLFNLDSTSVRVTISSAKLPSKNIFILLSRLNRGGKNFPSDSIKALLKNLQSNSSILISDRVIEIAEFSTADQVDRLKDIMTDRWLLQNKSQSVPISAQQFNKIQDAVVVILEKTDPNFKTKIVTAGSLDNYLYGKNLAGNPLYVRETPIKMFATIFNTLSYKLLNQEDTTFVVEQINSWKIANGF